VSVSLTILAHNEINVNPVVKFRQIYNLIGKAEPKFHYGVNLNILQDIQTYLLCSIVISILFVWLGISLTQNGQRVILAFWTLTV